MMKLGAVAVPRNPGLRKEEVVHISEKSFDASWAYCGTKKSNEPRTGNKVY